MSISDIQLSRISKLFVDRDQANAETALVRRQGHSVIIFCGEDVAASYTLQLAALTAASIASRCFPEAVQISLCPKTAEAPLLLWPSLKLTFGSALRNIVGQDNIVDCRVYHDTPHALVFGNAPPVKNAVRVTFDGWTAKVGPASDMSRLPEREYFSVAGVLAAALALSELFLSFADISVEATRRVVGLSLWRPDLNIDDPQALGIFVEYLPRELWVLGLGHLGNAYLWALGTLPYRNSSEVEFFLNDFDRVEPENIETGIIFTSANEGDLKTRACCAWLERRGFQTRLIERRFDASFRRDSKEPGLALCGFDSNAVRRDLATAQFLRVIDSGLGGMSSNFDTISFHTLPNARTAAELWPDLSADDERKRVEQRERVARDNPGYSRLAKDECGRFELVNKSVAVPFVGATAATLVIAEAVRLLHDGPAYTDIKLSLGVPNKRFACIKGNYSPQDATGLKFVDRRNDHYAPTGISDAIR
jgi:hypothetical protein